jgi:hypothetical protein
VVSRPTLTKVLGELARRFNKLGETLRTDHNDRYQRVLTNPLKNAVEAKRDR